MESWPLWMFPIHSCRYYECSEQGFARHGQFKRLLINGSTSCRQGFWLFRKPYMVSGLLNLSIITKIYRINPNP